MIDRYDPFGRTLSLRQMMDRLMEDAFVMPRGGETPAMDTPAMDVYEEGDNVVIETPLPGMKPDDIDINIEHGTLTIRGESKSAEERKDRNYLIREQRMGRFQRSLRLPDTVDTNACQASYDNGVLRLTLPKSEQAKPRRIPVTGGSQSERQPMVGSGGQSTVQNGGSDVAQAGRSDASSAAGRS
jgi:HSP20 family protein